MWDQFLATVGGANPGAGVLEKVVEFYSKTCGVQSHEALDGLVESDLDFTKLDLEARAFARRAFRKAESLASCRAAASAALSQGASSSGKAISTLAQNGHGHNPEVVGMLDVLGSEASAGAIAQVLAHCDKTVDIQAKLNGVMAGKLQFHLWCDAPVWKLLNAESVAAASDSRVAFAYVDLTSRAFLPMWLPADAIGGTAISPTSTSEWALDPSASSATLGALGAALKAATQTPRFFRSLAQWTAVFMRYGASAVAMEHLTWSAVLSHVDVVMRISEELRAASDSMFVAVLYDDLLRRAFADRAAKKDPELNIEKEMTKVNKEILALAKSRLGQVLAAAGIANEPRRSSGSDPLTVSAESVLAKQSAAADALSRKAEQAVRQMAQQQESLERRKLALEAN